MCMEGGFMGVIGRLLPNKRDQRLLIPRLLYTAQTTLFHLDQVLVRGRKVALLKKLEEVGDCLKASCISVVASKLKQVYKGIKINQ